MSLRKLGMAATPGRLRMALLMSRPPPGLRLISLVPMRRKETGASSSPLAVAATTSAASTVTVNGSRTTVRNAGRAGVISTSSRVAVLYPTELKDKLTSPGCNPDSSKAPSKSVEVPVTAPWTTTDTKGRVSPVTSSVTTPLTDAVWA